MSNHVIILGCGRSGTSIFGEFFEHLEGYDYFSEPPFDDMLEYDYSSPIAVKVPRESEKYPPDDGLSISVESLLEVVPEPRTIFWIVRHPLDTICSLKVGISKNWGHHPRPKDYKQWLDKPLIEQCAYHWNYLNSKGYTKVKDLSQIVHFEDLIMDTEKFVKKLCQETNIDISSNQEAIDNWCARVQNSNNKSFSEAKTSRAYSTQDHSVRVERWKENLTQEELDKILPMVQETAYQLGYPL